MDRLKELSGASVPFPFDLHAMIYAEDAPGMERELHQKFDQYRVNRVNRRKEFFRVPLAEIEAAARHFDPNIEFYREHEAREFFISMGGEAQA